MFTGLIEEVGQLTKILPVGSGLKLQIKATSVLEAMRLGDSLAVNGVCLTVTALTKENCMVDVVPETVRRSTLGTLRLGHAVNLERAMPANGRFGGHIVAGHVDGVGRIASLVKEDNALVLSIAASEAILRYVIEKGSITIDGISLTVMQVNTESFTVSIIPHTAMVTTLSIAKVGQNVNLEVDLVAKYIERFTQKTPSSPSLTIDRLRTMGY